MLHSSKIEQSDILLEFKDKNGKQIKAGCYIRLSELGRQKLIDFKEKEVGLSTSEDDRDYVVSYRGFVKGINQDGTISVLYDDDNLPEDLRLNSFLPEDLIVQ